MGQEKLHSASLAGGAARSKLGGQCTSGAVTVLQSTGRAEPKQTRPCLPLQRGGVFDGWLPLLPGDPLIRNSQVHKLSAIYASFRG